MAYQMAQKFQTTVSGRKSNSSNDPAGCRRKIGAADIVTKREFLKISGP